MHLITTLTYVILLCVINVELSLFKDQFRLFVKSVANQFHVDWRQNLLRAQPHLKNRFKLTNDYRKYNSSDFIYPMILTVGSCIVHRNLKVARDRYNSSIVYVDILNMEYDELPLDRAYDNLVTARIACRQVLRYARNKRLINRNVIEQTSKIIHNAWMKRNQNQQSTQLMIPYEDLSETEKDKDRHAVIVACRLFNELNMYHKFNTTPIRLIQDNTQ